MKQLIPKTQVMLHYGKHIEQIYAESVLKRPQLLTAFSVF